MAGRHLDRTTEGDREFHLAFLRDIAAAAIASESSGALAPAAAACRERLGTALDRATVLHASSDRCFVDLDVLGITSPIVEMLEWFHDDGTVVVF